MTPTAVARTIRTSRAVELLLELISIDTRNPMGQPVEGTTSVEGGAITTIEKLFAPHLDQVRLVRQRCSPVHENLIITWDVNRERRPALFESHIDTVPATGWSDRALQPRVVDDRILGLGACDDKGSLTAMIVALLQLLERGVAPPRSVILVCAGDEEFAQTGIHRFMKDLGGPPAYGIFGEPTRLQPVVQHKGTVRWDISVHGRSAHSCRPELGINAITGMMDVIAELRVYQELLQARSLNPLLTGPTITVTQISGGRTRNAMPDECTIAVDFRVMPGMDPRAERDAIIEHLTCLPWTITHGPVQLMTPPLDTDPESPASQQLLMICRRFIGPQVQLIGAPYGTDAAWVGHCCPAIVIGPGDISHAHAVDEQVSITELEAAVDVYEQMMMEPLEHLP